ncbi:hypothetical protein TNCV_2183491 [Trichonephila clavipes]|nr:hypothetical protein TNCV_2183491 [Trichonephila clavipes]
MCERARSVKSVVSKMASVKCSREAVTNICRDWIIKLETRSPRQTCGRHRFPSARFEKRIAKFIQSNRTAICTSHYGKP